MVLEAIDVTVRFGGHVALDDASISVVPGAIRGLIGPNGAGKTTLFNVCSGFQAVKSGKVLYDGRDITSMSSIKRARLGVSRTFQRMQLFASLTCLDNVLIAAETSRTRGAGDEQGRRVRKSSDRERAERTLLEVGLGGFADKPARDLTTGQGRLLELARALVRNPSYLLLDEPSSGLDVKETRQFGDLLAEVTERNGFGVLLVEHDMDLVLRVTEHITVLTEGRVLAVGSPRDIRSSQAVRAAYLGDEVGAA
ncbi:ABC transporter ATP-binding protein [Dactylosporangium sp. NPDC051484]|uniref:ABC transporter ATP-binding protein n=1 Tax=Dactylosporangium sp. NPDC051484 TaxID=3154942 RepID=UPI00344F7D6D